MIALVEGIMSVMLLSGLTPCPVLNCLISIVVLLVGVYLLLKVTTFFRLSDIGRLFRRTRKDGDLRQKQN